MTAPARLVALEVEPRRLRLRRPLVTAKGAVTTRDVWLVRLRDAEGRVGIGEAAPMRAAGTESRRDCADALGAIDAAWLGTVPLEGASRACLGLRPAGSASPGGPWEAMLVAHLRSTPAARAALDAALWDLAGQRRGAPIAALLRGATAPPAAVPVNALVRDAASAAAAAEAGFEVLKTKLTSPTERPKLDAIRAAAPGCRLRVDFNGAFADSDAAALGLAALGRVDLVEQPVPAGDLAGLAALRGIGPRIAADESVADTAAGHAVIAEGAADVLVLKPTRLGGLGPCARLALAARAAGLDAYVTTMLDGAVGRTAALHLAAAIHRPGGPAHGLATGALLAEDLAAVPGPRRGLLAVPTAPGLGVRA